MEQNSNDIVRGLDALDYKPALWSMYVLSRYTLTEMARIMNTYPSTVHRKLIANGIEPRAQGPKAKRPGQQITIEDLFQKSKSNLDFTRDDCSDAPMPCPMVSCRHNTYLDVDRNGDIAYNHWQIGEAGQKVRPLEVWELTVPNCSLHVAMREVKTIYENENGEIVEETITTPPEALTVDGEITLEWIADKYLSGITRERVRQIAEKAMERMKKTFTTKVKKAKP